MKDYKALIAKADADIEAAKQARDPVAQEWWAKLKEFESARDAALAPFNAAVTAAESARHNLVCEERDTELAKLKSAVEQVAPGTLPSFEDFRDYSGHIREITGNKHLERVFYRDCSPLAAPNVPGLLLMANSENCVGGGVNIYGAWSPEGKLVGLLSVQKARHPGDATEAYGEINGKPVEFEEGANWGVKAPVKTWVAELKKL